MLLCPLCVRLTQVDYEHGNTPVTYTLQFDAIVAALWDTVDPLHVLRFNGMNLCVTACLCHAM